MGTGCAGRLRVTWRLPLGCSPKKGCGQQSQVLEIQSPAIRGQRTYGRESGRRQGMFSLTPHGITVFSTQTGSYNPTEHLGQCPRKKHEIYCAEHLSSRSGFVPVHLSGTGQAI